MAGFGSLDKLSNEDKAKIYIKILATVVIQLTGKPKLTSLNVTSTAKWLRSRLKRCNEKCITG